MSAPRNHGFDASVDGGLSENGDEHISLKLSSPVVEINVSFTYAEADSLVDVLGRRDRDRGLAIGASAKNKVYWARDDEKNVYILVGGDDETWDIGITLSDAAFRMVLEEITEFMRRRKGAA